MTEQILIDLTEARKEIARFHENVDLTKNEVGRVEKLVKTKMHEITEKIIRIEERLNKLEKGDN